jgi:hypothetical protein
VRYDLSLDGTLLPRGASGLALTPASAEEGADLFLEARTEEASQQWVIDGSVESLQIESVSRMNDVPPRAPSPAPAPPSRAPVPKPRPSASSPVSGSPTPSEPSPSYPTSNPCAPYYCWPYDYDDGYDYGYGYGYDYGYGYGYDYGYGYG